MRDDIPRRIRIDKFTPAERAIYDAVQAVEAAGCDPRLTKAVSLLCEARERVADYVDGVGLDEVRDAPRSRELLPGWRKRPPLTHTQTQ